MCLHICVQQQPEKKKKKKAMERPRLPRPRRAASVCRLDTLKDFQAGLSCGHLYSNSLFLSGLLDMLNIIKPWHVGGKKFKCFLNETKCSNYILRF